MKRELFVVRVKRAPALLPSGYKRRRNTTVTGRARTGEIAKRGLVAHTEDWEGRVAALGAPAAIRYIKVGDAPPRPMTMKEMIERGYFVLGRGPKGVRHIKEGIHEPSEAPSSARR